MERNVITIDGFIWTHLYPTFGRVEAEMTARSSEYRPVKGEEVKYWARAGYEFDFECSLAESNKYRVFVDGRFVEQCIMADKYNGIIATLDANEKDITFWEVEPGRIMIIRLTREGRR